MKTTTHSTRLSEMLFDKASIRSFLFLLFFLGIQNSFAQKTWDGGAGNNSWSSDNNWNPNGEPSPTDNVTIGSGFTVILNTDANIASLTLGGQLTIGNSNTNRSLAVSGNVTINNGATLTATGDGGNDFNIGGNFTNNGTFTDNVGDVDVNFNGGTQTISGSGSYTFRDFLISTSGTKNINSSITVTRNWTNNGGTTAGTGTVTFNGTTQTVGGSSASNSFGNVILSGGTKTFSKPVFISGNLSIASGGLANFGSLTTNTAGTLTLGGLGTLNARFGSTSTSATAPVYKNNTYFTSGTTGFVTVGTQSCTAPTITFGSIPTICQGATTFSLPYTATTGSPNLYSISGTGITSVTNGSLNAPASSINVNLNSPASVGTISASTFTVSSSVTGCVSANINGSVTVNSNVGTPTFTAGSIAECQDAADETYTATATNSTGISYSVSTSGAGTINPSTGVMNWLSTFSGSATITATATGCNGPVFATRVVTVTATVGTPTFTAGATSECQDAPNETYTATATNSTGITYSVSPSGAGTINSSTGVMDWNPGFTGTATITASAAGCNGPRTATRSVSVTPTVGIPTFTAGSVSECQDAANETYTATATNSTGITYSVSPPAAGTINSSTGVMNWASNFSGSATITASAAGCNGPRTFDRVVTVTPTVGVPNFTAGATSLCVNSPDETYTATATNATGITYSVSPSGAGSIGSSSGIMNWNNTFTGTATIIASAAGCNGPVTANRVVNIIAVGTPSFTAGSTSVCQNNANTTYTATASNSTSITYSVSPTAAGVIDSVTGVMNWDSAFTGNATITASAAGCGGPRTANRIVEVKPTVGSPEFVFGPSSVCQDADSALYIADASDNEGISYSVSPSSAGFIIFGFMNWSSSFSGTAIITATASGCNGPKSTEMSVIVTPTVGTPVFTVGATTVCQDNADTTYTATATDATGISYSVSPSSAGTIGSATGIMNWNASFNGTATITATATGCNGPRTATRNVTVTPTVTALSFTSGATTICQDNADTTYTATAINSTAITYSVLPVEAGIIGSSNGVMNWNASFSGTATVTASAAGCNGPISVNRIVTVTPAVGTPIFTVGATLVCQDNADTTYTATATNSTAITYSVLPVGAGVIGSSNGLMNWNASFSGTATITAIATGCTGSVSNDISVTVTPTVGTPSFTAGAITVCQNATDTTYTAIASDSTGITYSVTPITAGTINSLSGVMNWNASFSGMATITATATGCNGPSTFDRVVTVNPLPVVTASDVVGCSGSAIALIGSGNPVGGSGSFSVSNPYIGSSSTTYTYTYTDTNGCSATSVPANITITAQPLWYADIDGDGFGDNLSTVNACTVPSGYVSIGGDCDDNNEDINPDETEICYNNIDDNCNELFSENCIPVVVNMTPSYDGYTLTSFANGIPAVAYTYPDATNIKYRFSITNLTTGQTSADIIQTSRYVSIPAALHLYNASYTIKASAVINEEIIQFAGNTITITAPTVQLTSLSSTSCGVTLASLTSTLSAHSALNATGYTFRIRLNNNDEPVYYTSQSATRFIGANTFTGFPLQYATSYKVSVEYTFTDPVTNLPVQSGYGAECTVNTPEIPVTTIVSPVCGSQAATMNATVTAKSAPYATGYQFRIRLFSTPTGSYYLTPITVSRFSSLAAFQTTLAYGTEYSVSVRYSVLNGSSTEWSEYGPECMVKTPFFPSTMVIPSQCGQSNVALNYQFNIVPYPGFPQYVVKLDELSEVDEGFADSQEITTSYSHFRLNQFSIAQIGKRYNVSIALKINGITGDFHTVCDFDTLAQGGAGDAVKSNENVLFEANAYPNPFASNFMLDIKTATQSSVNIKVYDMIGRMIEQKDISVSEMESTTIGDQYPSGVYNVIVSQAENVQTIRVIKR